MRAGLHLVQTASRTPPRPRPPAGTGAGAAADPAADCADGTLEAGDCSRQAGQINARTMMAASQARMSVLSRELGRTLDLQVRVADATLRLGKPMLLAPIPRGF